MRAFKERAKRAAPRVRVLCASLMIRRFAQCRYDVRIAYRIDRRHNDEGAPWFCF